MKDTPKAYPTGKEGSLRLHNKELEEQVKGLQLALQLIETGKYGRNELISERDQLRAELEKSNREVMQLSGFKVECNRFLDRLALATSLLRRAHPNMHTCEVSQWFNDVNEFLKG